MKLILSITFLCFHFAVTAQHTVSIDSVSSYIGQSVTVCSKVFGTHITKGEKPLTYLNLGAEYPNQKLTLVIFCKDISNFSLSPDKVYKQMEVCVTGKLTMYKERHQIVINHQDMISFITK